MAITPLIEEVAPTVTTTIYRGTNDWIINGAVAGCFTTRERAIAHVVQQGVTDFILRNSLGKRVTYTVSGGKAKKIAVS